MKSQPLNAPRLRFPKYTDLWKLKTLIELSEDGFNNGVFNDPKKVGKGYRIINVKDMYVGDSIDIEKLTKVDIDEKEFLKNKIEFGDILFTRSSLVKEGIAHSNVNLSKAEDLTYDGHLIRMRPRKEITDSLFLAYCFSTTQARKQFITRGKTTTMTTIGQEDIASVSINIPSLAEQQKIASFLTSVDIKIEQLTKKKTLLGQYKKGVMQKIFNQEIRFKDENGKGFPEWEEKKLGEVSDCLDNKRKPLNQAERQDKKGEYPYWGANNIMDYLDDYIFDEPIVLLAEDGGNFNEFSTRPIANYYEGKCWVNNHTHVLTGKKSILDSKFLYFSLVHKDITGFVSGGTRSKLIKSEMLKIEIGLPAFAEQTKIANFLSALDTKINHTNTLLEKTKLWKKGLLQQLFV